MPNHEQSMCEFKKTSRYFTNKTTPLFSPNLPSRTWAGYEFCKPLPAQTESLREGASLSHGWVLGTSQNLQHRPWQMKHLPSKGLPAQGLCY